MSRKGALYIDQLVELCVKCLLQKAVHAPCSLCWLHKWGGLKAQLLHIAPGNARGSDVALIKVSRSVRAAFLMRGNAPLGVKGINGLRAFGAWHFCAGAKMPNVSIAVYVPPGRCPGLWATIGLTARPTCAANAVKSCIYMSQFQDKTNPSLVTGLRCKPYTRNTFDYRRLCELVLG